MTINDLSSYLASQGANTKDTPYFIALKIDSEDDFEALKTTLYDTADKYVCLDLSGSTITSIPKDAFYDLSTWKGCVALTEITIPDTVTSIRDHAFFRCDSLTDINIPDNVKNIGKSAFACCTNLASVTIGNGVKDILHNAFFGCTSLTTINVADDNTAYTSQDGVLYNKDKTFLHTYPSGKTNASFTIPNSVTSIGSATFLCASLTAINVTDFNSAYTAEDGVLYNKEKTVLHTYPSGKTASSFIIPDSVTSIGNNSFRECTNLESVTIPDSVTGIGTLAFCCCTKLASVTIGNGVTEIGYGAFYGCSSLKNVNIPNSVTGILVDAFFGCTGLESVIISNNVTSIGHNVFRECTNLASISIPNSVTSIESWAFFNCANLSSVTFKGTIPSSGFCDDTYCLPFLGDLRDKFYATDAVNGTPGTYTTTTPVDDSSVWTKQ
jgi:hypothetical protein